MSRWRSPGLCLEAYFKLQCIFHWAKQNDLSKHGKRKYRWLQRDGNGVAPVLASTSIYEAEWWDQRKTFNLSLRHMTSSQTESGNCLEMFCSPAAAKSVSYGPHGYIIKHDTALETEHALTQSGNGWCHCSITKWNSWTMLMSQSILVGCIGDYWQ
jgi:hypothetical protein